MDIAELQEGGNDPLRSEQEHVSVSQAAINNRHNAVSHSVKVRRRRCGRGEWRLLRQCHKAGSGNHVRGKVGRRRTADGMVVGCNWWETRHVNAAVTMSLSKGTRSIISVKTALEAARNIFKLVSVRGGQ